MANPKLAMIPTGYKAGKVYSVLPESGVGDFTFDRNSKATRVNEDGLIEVMDNDVPRLDYTDGGCPNFLLEPQSSNALPYSNKFLNTGWQYYRGTITDNATISPDGTLNASKYQEDSQTGSHLFRRQSLSITNGLSYTGSIFAKKGELTSILLQSNSSSRWVASASFDLENGTVTSGTGVIKNYGNGWYRCSISGDAVQTTTDAGIEMYTSVGAGRNGDGLFMYGAQFEQSSYPTSYIPTNGSTVTRVGETCNGAGDASTFNDSEGVLMAEISALADDADTLRWINLNNGLTSNRVAFYYRPDINQLTYLVTSNNVGQVFLTITLSSASSFNKIVAKYKQNDFALWTNGFEVATDTSGNAPIGLNELSFDNAVGGDNFYGNTKQIQYFDSALTDAELETLTSWQSFSEMANGQNYTII